MDVNSIQTALQQLYVTTKILRKLSTSSPDLLISDFIYSVLSEEPKIFLFSMCQLQHIVALTKALEKILKPNAFGDVLQTFKVPIDEVLMF